MALIGFVTFVRNRGLGCSSAKCSVVIVVDGLVGVDLRASLPLKWKDAGGGRKHPGLGSHE